jgi:hypothetical protein
MSDTFTVTFGLMNVSLGSPLARYPAAVDESPRASAAIYALTIDAACSEVFAPVMRTALAVGAATTAGAVAVAAGSGALGACVAAAGVGVSTITTCVAFGFGLADGDALGDTLGLGDAMARGDFDGDGEGEGEGDGGNDSAEVNVAVASGSGVKLGAEDGACTALGPRNFVRSPPNAKPQSTTRITSGMIGIPPRFGGSGSSRRRRG